MTFGLDYSSGRPAAAALKTAGVSFVARYIGSTVRGTGRSAKWLTPSEAKARHDDGLAVVVVFEYAAKRPEDGGPAGTADAHTAVAELAYCDLPADLPVYWAVDYDTTVGPHIRAYFKAIAAVVGVKRVGAYGSYRVIKALLDEGLITYAMQTYAWSGGKWDPRAQIQQYLNGQTIGGASVDYDRAMHADYGQWAAAGTPAPAVKPWPGRYLKLASPLMHGSDVKWVQQHLTGHDESELADDGEYGKLTAAAVHAFQKAKKLTVDGIVGKQTWDALGK